jgi:hypothetical protein
MHAVSESCRKPQAGFAEERIEVGSGYLMTQDSPLTTDVDVKVDVKGEALG